MDLVRSPWNWSIWNALAGVSGTATPSGPFTAGATGPSQYFTLKVRNGTKLDAPLFVLGKGQDPGHHKEGQYAMVEAYLHFNDGGVASFVPATTAGPSGAYARKLSDFPSDPKDPSLRVLTIPKTIGGRLYFSFAEPVVLSVVEGKDPQGRAVSKTLAEPDPFKLDDPSYYVLYDKVEFTFNDLGVWIDTTAVDFFCMPVALHFEGRPGTAVGLAQPRAAVLRTVADAFAGPWGRLRLTHPNPDGKEAVLRILAPNKAIGRRDPAENFPADYLQTAIQAVWTHYRASGASPSPADHVLRVDCGELIGFGFPLSDVAGGKLTAANALFTGWVTADGATFHFENSTKDVVRVALPQSNQVFGCDGGSMTCVPNTAASVVVRELGAAMTVGLLPLPDRMKNPATGKLEDVALCRSFFTRPDVKKLFYTNSPALPPTPAGPAYNLYSKVLHSFGDKVYAFAFDDAVGEDSTLHSSDTDPNVPDVSTPYVVVLGDMTGSVLPDIHDDTHYHVTLTPGWGGKGTYVAPDGKTLDFAWPSNCVIPDVTCPFRFQYDVGAGRDTFEVAVNVRRVRCLSSAAKVSLGVDWHVEGTAVTLSLEGAPR